MVRAVLHLMEPMPPIDIEPFRNRLEDAWWRAFYGVKSQHADWWERTSFRLWSTMLQLVRDYQIPLPTNLLRMIRATLLYDTVAARLDRNIDVFEEYRKHIRFESERVKREVQEDLWRQLVDGPDPSTYVNLQRLTDIGQTLLFRVERLLNEPTPSFVTAIAKGYELLRLLISWALTTFSVSLFAFLLASTLVYREVAAREPERNLTFWAMPETLAAEFDRAAATIGMSPLEWILLTWGVLVAFVTVRHLRSAWLRISDLDVN